MKSQTLLLVTRLEERLTPASINWIGAAMTGGYNAFSNPANWQGGVRPGPGDTAVFGALAQTYVVVDVASAVDGVVFDGTWNQWMVLEGTLTTTLQSTWNRGSIFDGTGSGFWDNVGTISLAGEVVALVGATLSNRGKVQIQNPGLNLNFAAILINDLGIIDFQSDGDINSPTSGASTLSNTGQIKKTGGLGTSEVTSIISNANIGIWDAQVGTLIMRNAGGSNTGGKFYASKDATLDVSGGYVSTWEGIYQGGGEGNIVHNAGIITIGKEGASFSITKFQWGNGEINGGTWSNHGTIDIIGGFALLNGPECVLNNLGTVNHLHNGNLNFAYGATFNNANSSCVLDFKADGDFYWSSGYPCFFTNKGLVRKSGGTGVSMFSGVSVSSLGGFWEAQTGTLEMTGNNGTHTGGFFNAAAGATVDINGYSTATWNGEFNGVGPGEVVWNGGAMYTGQFGVRFDFQEPNLFHWRGGAVLAGTLHNEGVMNIDGSFVGVDGMTAVLHNTGIINHSTANVLYMYNGSNLLNDGGIYDFQNNGSIYYNGTGAPPTFVNAGLLRKSGGTGTSYVNGSFVANNGTVDVASGYLSISAPLFMDQPSFLIGDADLLDSVTNKAGTINPGTSPVGFSTAQLGISGPFVQSDNGNITVDIAGTKAGTGHDQILVYGPVSLGGLLYPRFGYAPQPNDAFVILANDGSDPINGTFAGLPEGQSFSVDGITMTISYKGGDGNDVQLKAQSTVVAPPRVESVQINGGVAQRSRVTSATVNFSSIVSLPPTPESAFQLFRQGNNAKIDLSASVVNTSKTSVTLTFSGTNADFASLKDGLYTLTVFANQVSGSGGALDGNGDGTAGDDYTLVGTPTNKLFRLFGDGNGDATVNASDFALFRSVFGLGGASAFDFNNDNQTNASDFAQFRARFGISLSP